MTTLSAEAYLQGIRDQNRVILSQAITLIESTREDHQKLARDVVSLCLPFSNLSFRMGITGAPGVGKSTFIDALGIHLVESGKHVAVLAIDPSSQKTSGSILGDKTRMARLSRHPKAFIRPSPNSGTLGGIASRTREAMILCEAAGFDIIFVETVGVGQSEFSVHQLVDILLLLVITGAGDDLQGIKRGIMEMADLIIINKADGENTQPARQLKRLLRQATHVLPSPRKNWETRVVEASSINGAGIDDIATSTDEFEALMRTSGDLTLNRGQQALAWMRRHIEEGLHRLLVNDAEVSDQLSVLEEEVLQGKTNPITAADAVLKMLER